MKRQFLLIPLLLSIPFLLISWGVTGHRTIGRIAENHLTPQAKAAIRDLLGNQSLADVSTWADEVRNQPDYRQTGPWHYVNLPLGLSYPEFQKQLERMGHDNVYGALLEQEVALADKSTPREKKIEALKFIVHFIGDLHQPMHVSRAEDRGGNTIQLNYDGEGMNLHSLWDTKLVERQGLGYEQLAEKYDHADPAQIRQWQSDPLSKWVWESYEISSTLYAEVDAMANRKIDDAYYQAHQSIVAQRITQAGIRLAGVLNAILKDGFVAGPAAAQGTASGATPSASTSTSSPAAPAIDIRDAASHIDEYATICDRIYGYKELESVTLVNLGGAYPNQLLTVVLKGQARDTYKVTDGQSICVKGKIVLYKGKPEIVVTDAAQLSAGK